MSTGTPLITTTHTFATHLRLSRALDMPPVASVSKSAADATSVHVSHLLKRPLTFASPVNARNGDVSGVHPSPGEHFASRCIVTPRNDVANEYVIYAASGKNVFCTTTAFDDDSENADVKRGKEGVLQPSASPATTRFKETHLVAEMRTAREIQSISVSNNPESPLVCVDNFGFVHTWSRKLGDEGEWRDGSLRCFGGDGRGVPGWCGALMSEQGERIFVANQSNRTINVWDAELGQEVRQINTLLPAYSARLLPSGDDRVIAVAEGHQLALYDDRVAEKGGCVTRLSIGYNKNVYAVATSRAPGFESIVACGGEERVVQIIDIRTSGAAQRWRNALKFDITMLELSETSKEFAYVAGLDYECVCGNWRAQSVENGFAFRADSRWMGLSACTSTDGTSDVLAGWSESGHVYAARTHPKK